MSALFGGGGGGTTAGGASVHGGAGGANSNGVAPGGGGGAATALNANGFDGAAGRVVITCWGGGSSTSSPSSPSSPSSTLSGSSLITGILSYSITPTSLGTYDPTPFLNAQPGKEWIQLGQGTWNGSSYDNIQYPNLRIPNDGPYRFRVIGFARISGQIRDSNDRIMLKIYVNGVDSGASEITFSATVNYATTPIDQFVDIAELKRGDLIQPFFKTTSGRIPNNAFYMQAGFSILIAGNTCHGTKSLDDYAVTNNSTSLLGDRSTGVYYQGADPPIITDGGPGSG
jgi:hypothetical protein